MKNEKGLDLTEQGFEQGDALGVLSDAFNNCVGAVHLNQEGFEAGIISKETLFERIGKSKKNFINRLGKAIKERVVKDNPELSLADLQSMIDLTQSLDWSDPEQIKILEEKMKEAEKILKKQREEQIKKGPPERWWEEK